jgi:hypothetical protein
MSQVRPSPQDVSQSIEAIASRLRHLPGAEQVSKITDATLNRIGAVSPQGRRMAVYAGAGMLGLAGVVEWPVALTGAAVAWLTQPRPAQSAQEEKPQGNGSSHEAQGGTAQGIAPPGRDVLAHTPSKGDEAVSEGYGAGDRLAPSHFRHDQQHVHEQPAKVGDPATASALKQVAEASAHHGDSDLSSEHSANDRAQ